MVIEHIFVTTLPVESAMARASEFLGQCGFVSDAATDTNLSMRRGKLRARGARNIAELPQTIRLRYDRGRVSMAISIAPSAAWGGSSFGAEPKATARRMRLHRELLTAIALGLEILLAAQEPPEKAALGWHQIENQITAAARARKWRHAIIITLALLGAAALITAAVMHEH